MSLTKVTNNMVENPDDFEITSTGSSTARKLSDRFSDVLNVKDFGAAGDGVTDDTVAIQSTFSYANPRGIKVLFPRGTYLVSDIIDIQVSVDFDNAELLISPDVEGIIRITPEYQKVMMTGTLSEFKKYQTKLSGFDNYPYHFMVVDSNDLDLNRNHSSGQVLTKNSVTLLGTKGNLIYPLTTTFNTINQIELSPTNIRRVIINNLTVRNRDQSNTPRNCIQITRNCVTLNNTRYIDTSVGGDIDLTSFISTSFVYDVELNGLTCDALSDGRMDYNYTVLTWKTLKLSIKGLKSFEGWAQLDGNYTRDVTVRDSTIDRIGGHYSYWDCTFENIKASRSRCIDLSGGGRLDIRNIEVILHPDFMSGSDLVAIGIRGDYAAEWDGDILIDGVTVDARGISALSAESTYNVLNAFCDSSSASFNYGRATNLAKSITIRSVNMLINSSVNNKWNLRVCGVGYVGAPSSDSQYPEGILIEDVNIVGKSRTWRHDIVALDYFGAVKPPTKDQWVDVRLDSIRCSDPRFAGQNPSTGISSQKPTLDISNQARGHINVRVSNCDWFKMTSEGHASSETQVNISDSSVMYLGGNVNNIYTLSDCSLVSTRFEGDWRGIFNSCIIPNFVTAQGSYGSIGYPNDIEHNIAYMKDTVVGNLAQITSSTKTLSDTQTGIYDTSYFKVSPVTIITGSGTPNNVVTPQFIGETYLDNSSGNYQMWDAVGLSNTSWKLRTNQGQAGDGDPTGTVLPRYLGDEYFDTTAREWYKSTSSTLNTGWVKISI